MAKPAISGLPQSIFVSSAALIVDGVDVGLISGLKISIKELTTPVNTDQLGKMVVNHFHVGDEATGECTFDEFTAINMKKAFPQATLLTSGGASRLSFGKQVGSDYLSLAKSFKIIPTSDDTSYAGRHFYFNKGVFMGEASVEYGPDKKLVFKSKMHFYPDVTQPSGMWIGYMGDNAVGALVPAAAGAAVPGGSNVGNGTVGSLSVNSTFTKTESWTLTCIHAVANGGLFSVVGSVSGAKGVATVGSSYVTNVITPANSELGFTVADGAIDFAIGDTFAIATTAANYV
jgi:hypothetical protein